MNRFVFAHTVRQRWRTAVILGLAMGAFQYLVLLTSSSFFTASQDAPLPSFLTDPPRAIRAFLGGATDLFSPGGWLSSAMLHPIALSLASVTAMLVPAASGVTELERGTLDIVLARPIGRRAYLRARLAATLVVMGGAQLLTLAGMLIGWRTIDGVESLTAPQIFIAWGGAVLLFSFFSAAGMWIFVVSRQRGRALGWAVALIVGSFLANFLALAFDQMEFLGPISPFRYFRVPSLVSGDPWGRDFAILGLATISAGLGALWSFGRRDLTR